jgi:hypothetical protein
MEEKFLYHIWDAGHLLTPLKTVSGKTLHVRYQGQFNTNRGPDFRNVILELDGEILKGDVEIHINSYDWKAHEHHEDPHFNNVILHVVMNAGNQQFTILENGEITEILELKDQLSDDIRKLLETPAVLADEERSTYCNLLSAVDNDTLITILAAWGMRRFKNKVRRFNASLLVNDFDQVLYEGMMESLGYNKNKQNMLSLAQSITLENIRDWNQEGMTGLDLAAIFCCASGLLDKSTTRLGSDLTNLIKTTYENQGFFARNLDLEWQLFRIRPANHPVFRIFAISGLIQAAAKQGFLNYFLERVFDGNKDVKKAFPAFGTIFSETVLPGAEKLPRPGRAIMGNIFINILLPISYMYFDKISLLPAKENILSYYNTFSPLQENHITRFMGRYLSPAHQKLANSRTIYQQGLMEIYRRFCHYHLCEECMAANIGDKGL